MLVSAYEVNNKSCLFKKVFVLDIFPFSYYANNESDDVINSSTKNGILNQEYLQKYWSSVL